MPVPDKVDMKRAEAEKILAVEKAGNYIFRTSAKSGKIPGLEGTLSYKDTQGNIRHVGVKNVADRFVVEYQHKVTQEKKYKELNEFIKSNNLTQYVNPEILATPKEATPQQQDSNPTPPKKAAPPDYSHIDRQIDPLFEGIHKLDQVNNAIMKAKDAGKILLTHLSRELDKTDRNSSEYKELLNQYNKVFNCVCSVSEAAKKSTPRNMKAVTEQVGKTNKAFKNASEEKQSLFKKFGKCVLIAVVVIVAIPLILAGGLGLVVLAGVDQECQRINIEKRREADALKQAITDPNSSISKSIEMVDGFIAKTNTAINQLQTKTDPEKNQQQTHTTDPHLKGSGSGFGPVGDPVDPSPSRGPGRR